AHGPAGPTAVAPRARAAGASAASPPAAGPGDRGADHDPGARDRGRGPLRRRAGAVGGEPGAEPNGGAGSPPPAPGPLVCDACGYALCGKSCRRPAAGQKERAYAYYRCGGTEPHRFGGERVCRGRQVRSDMLDAAVWEDVRSLLSDPERLRAEYERRLGRPGPGGGRGGGEVAAVIPRGRGRGARGG